MTTDEVTITRWRALLIGVRNYEDPCFAHLPHAVEDVTALYLASPASDYVTGAVFLVNGGMNVTSAMG